MLCLTPFTPYVVLATHVATEMSEEDLKLLALTNRALAPVAEASTLARDTFGICMKLYQYAELAVMGSQGQGSDKTGDYLVVSDSLDVAALEDCINVSSGASTTNSPFSDWQTGQTG